jgi:hypothetical protein
MKIGRPAKVAPERRTRRRVDGDEQSGVLPHEAREPERKSLAVSQHEEQEDQREETADHERDRAVDGVDDEPEHSAPELVDRVVQRCPHLHQPCRLEIERAHPQRERRPASAELGGDLGELADEARDDHGGNASHDDDREDKSPHRRHRRRGAQPAQAPDDGLEHRTEDDGDHERNEDPAQGAHGACEDDDESDDAERCPRHQPPALHGRHRTCPRGGFSPVPGVTM